MPLKLDHYDPDQRMKDRAQQALASLGLMGRAGPLPEVPPDSDPIRAAERREKRS